jgi:two-component system, chemotaxis family, CheB/CheR fusion protein
MAKKNIILTGDQKENVIPSINKQKASTFSKFPIVGIGASAGGLEALEQFFQNMPDNCGIAFVVIQHLDPNRPGIMPELLQRITTMKVIQATDRIKIKQNYVYVIPPNKNMALLNGALHLFDLVESHGLRLPIDYFFRSLANDQQEKSIGIILSGMGSDGSHGLKDIKEKNGIVLVQEPSSAKFDGMPRSAVEAVIADIIAPANELPVKLITYLKCNITIKDNIDIELKNISNLEKIIILLREHSGHDFSLYKKSTLFRRIERRKNLHQIDKLNQYVRFLQENPKEVEILFKELLIGVTNFFRDGALWDKLKDTILPALINEMPNGHILRAWIPGCSTGEEAYSLAIIFKEVLDKNKKNKNLALQIFATDLDMDAIDKARKGIFPSNITSNVCPEYIDKFFTFENERYQINSSIREMIVFAPQNVIMDPPFTKLDILSCRNMLIYMEPELQKKLISLFHYSLNPEGILILGSAETTGIQNHIFKELDAKHKIYKRILTNAPNNFNDFSSTFYRNMTPSITPKKTTKNIENIQNVVDQIMLQHYTPASVLINGAGDILYITGRTGKYLEPVAGKANWNIHAMAREGLRNELPSLLRKATQSCEPVKLLNVKINTHDNALFIDVIVQRIESPDSIKGMFMVVFNDLPIQTGTNIKNFKTGKHKLSNQQKELETELQRSYEEIKSIREEMQTSQEELKSTNEELQSTNEELQSTNEELQSSNEELTTSKEEMQSLNEELQTVNIELQSKVNDLIRVNDDIKNLLNSTEIATLFLDKELNIRRFTDHITQLFKLRTTDIGKPFTELVSDLQYPEIEHHAKQVIKTLISIESAISANNGRWFNVRIMPYRTIDDHIDGLVITFTDITTSKKLELELKKANDALRKTD